jgi:pSer/pThr/pTyr-binding forkhead associated (FHA) protein
MKQALFINEKPIGQDHILRNGDSIQIKPLPLEIIYRIVEEMTERTEDDTLGVNYETDAIA